MAVSIAKLAIQILTDTTRMSSGFRDAQDKLKRMGDDTKATSAGMSDGFGAVVARFFTLEKVLGAVRREFTFMSREAADAQDRMAELTNASKLETWRGQWERFSHNLGNSLVPSLNTATKLFSELLDKADQIRTGVFGLEGRDHERLRLQALADIQKKVADDAKKAEAERKHAAEEAARDLERLKDRAKSLADSFRTPSEKLADLFREMNDLAAKGFLSQDQLAKGISRASDEFRKQLRTQLEAKNATTGFAEKGSQRAFQAIAAARRNQEINDKVNEQLASILRANQENNALVKQDANRQPVKIVAGGF